MKFTTIFCLFLYTHTYIIRVYSASKYFKINGGPNLNIWIKKLCFDNIFLYNFDLIINIFVSIILNILIFY